MPNVDEFYVMAALICYLDQCMLAFIGSVTLKAKHVMYRSLTVLLSTDAITDCLDS